jgi:hypothetical protein
LSHRQIAFISTVLILVALGCAAPQRLGLSRVQVCLNAETGQRYEGSPRLSRGASVCADFEGAQ